MKIHITLVGGQPVPVYLGLKELQPEKIIYICSKSSRKEANTISSHYENISHEFIELDPVDITEIEAKAKSLYELFKFRKFNLQLLIYKCRKYVSYLPPC